MKTFIINIESYFNDKFMNVMNNAIDLQLTPTESVEIIYYYMKEKQKEIDRDTLMMELAELSLNDLVILFKKIKAEFLA